MIRGRIDAIHPKRIVAIDQHRCTHKTQPIDLELQMAKEILAEVFKVMISDVDEMIQIRYEEKVLWPEGFYLED